MARINLLPWRAERRKQRQKEFLTMLGVAALVGVLLSILVVGYYKAQISGQNERNGYMKDQIAQVDKQIKEIEELDKKKNKLLARKKVIEQLQSNRSQMVHLFDQLVRTIPDGVILTSIKQAGDKLTLSGRSQSNARVSAYMRTLESSGWMTKPDLKVIEAKGGEPGLPYSFTLSVMLVNPNAPKDTDGDGIPDTPATPPPPATEAPADAAASAPAAQSAPATPADAAVAAPAGDAPADKEAPAADAPATEAPAATPAPEQEGGAS